MSNHLRRIQRIFDEKHFDPIDGYANLNRRDQKVAHIGTHLGKITGRKLVHWANSGWEKPDMRAVVIGEVIPDLCIYRTQLSDLSSMPEHIVEANAEALKPGNLTVSKAKIHTALVEARGAIDDFVEPIMHGQDADYEFVARATVLTHFAVGAAAEQYRISPDELSRMHFARLIQLAGEHEVSFDPS